MKNNIDLDIYKIFSDIINDKKISRDLWIGGEAIMSLRLFQQIVEIPKKDTEEVSIKISEKLVHNPLIVNSGRKNGRESVMIYVKFELYKSKFSFKVLPTWSEISEAAILLNTSVIQETNEMIKRLTQVQSELLIENVLSSDKLEWIRKFQPSPTKTDDGGKDFTSLLLINENNTDIGLSGYGKMVQIIGQIKHYKGEVKPEKIREFIGTMKIFKKKFGLFISINGYTKKALETAKQSEYTIFCWDALDLAKIMVKNEIGIKKIRIKTGKNLDEEWWNEIHRAS